jgi:mono/diheme cytochrome c family protein
MTGLYIPSLMRLLPILLLLPAALAAQSSAPGQPLPLGVTADMVTKGKELFQGAGLCMACHGMDGKGSVGPDLTDTLWLHHKGSYEEILAQVIKGIPEDQSKSGAVMPPRGGSALSDEEIRAVAAYVWSLSRRPSSP